jgi:hypothetical protein
MAEQEKKRMMKLRPTNCDAATFEARALFRKTRYAEAALSVCLYSSHPKQQGLSLCGRMASHWMGKSFYGTCHLPKR